MNIKKLSKNYFNNDDDSFGLVNEIRGLIEQYEVEFANKGVKCSVRIEYKKENGYDYLWFSSRRPRESNDPKKRHHYKCAVIRFLPIEQKVSKPEDIKEYSFNLYYRRNNFVINYSKNKLLKHVRKLFAEVLKRLANNSVQKVCYNTKVDNIRYLHGNYKYKAYIGKRKRKDCVTAVSVYMLLLLVVLAVYLPICITYFCG